MRREKERKQNHDGENSRIRAKRKMEALLRFLVALYSSSGVISEVGLYIEYTVSACMCVCVSWFPLSAC